MRRNDLKNKIGSKNVVPSVKSIQVFDEKSNAYFNFINSLNSESLGNKSLFQCPEKV